MVLPEMQALSLLINLFPYLVLVATYQFNHVYTIGISPVGIANPDLSWESSTQTDIGLDFGLWNNRIGVVIDYYNKVTDKLLFDQALPLSSGYNTITKNFGKIENKDGSLQ
jgi:hypothetical protein